MSAKSTILEVTMQLLATDCVPIRRRRVTKNSYNLGCGELSQQDSYCTVTTNVALNVRVEMRNTFKLNGFTGKSAT